MRGDTCEQPALRLGRQTIFHGRASERVLCVTGGLDGDERTVIVGKPYRNLRARAPRDAEVDAIHLWSPVNG